MEKINKYKRKIFGLITIFLLIEFGVYPCLTAADTFSNIIGAIALLIMIIWGGLELYDYATSDGNLVDKNELKEAEKLLKEKQLGETELDYVPKPKTKAKRKPKTTKTK